MGNASTGNAAGNQTLLSGRKEPREGAAMTLVVQSIGVIQHTVGALKNRSSIFILEVR